MPSIQIPTNYFFSNEFANQTYKVATTLKNINITETITSLCNVTLNPFASCPVSSKGINMYCSEDANSQPAISASICGETIDEGFRCVVKSINYISCPTAEFDPTNLLIGTVLTLGIFAAGYGIYKARQFCIRPASGEVAPMQAADVEFANAGYRHLN